MKVLNIFSSLILVLFMATSIGAQSYQIRAVAQGVNTISIQMRESTGTGTPNTSSFLTDLVFGIRWSVASGDRNLGGQSGSYNMGKSGARKINSGFYFQAFGAGNTPFNFPETWLPGQFVEVMSISFTGSLGSGVTFEVVPSGFDPTTNPNIGVNLEDRTPSISGSAAFGPLPVELTSFYVQAQDDHTVQLNWETATELNNESFQIEHSINGIDFDLIGTQGGAGTTTEVQTYTFVHKNPQKGTNYYQLKQIDFDGQFEYSEVRSVDISADRSILRFYPNPTNDFIYFSTALNETEQNVSIFGANGQLLIQKKIRENRLDLTELPSGLYFIQLESNRYKEFIKVVRGR